jgi:hypothetical protein
MFIDVPGLLCRATPCKPVLFDTALIGIEWPNLEQKTVAQKKAGGFWSFWR